MTIFEVIAWSVIAGLVTWRVAMHRAQGRINRLTAQADTELSKLSAEAQRWKTRAAELSRQNEAWKAGHTQGRADVIAMMPLLVAATRNRGTCSACGGTVPAGGEPIEQALPEAPGEAPLARGRAALVPAPWSDARSARQMRKGARREADPLC